MTNNQRNTLIIGIVTLVVGMFIGAAIGEDFPIVGTAADSDEENVAATASDLYYLVELEDAQTWLEDTYPDIAENLTTNFENVVGIINSEEAFARVAETNEEDLQSVLRHTQAALVGVEDINEESDLSDEGGVLPRDLEIVACLAVDEDPFAGTDPAVKLYLVVPDTEDNTKNIPSDWEPVQPKSGTDMFWTPLLCIPDSE